MSVVQDSKGCSAGVLPDGRPTLPARRVVKVISYNILAPKYSGYNSYCPPQYLDWEYRRPLVLQELAHHDADLLGLQECDMEFFGKELADWMAERGMEGEFLPRNVGPVPGPTEGIALLWRSSVLEAVARRSIVFAEMDPWVAGLPQVVADSEPWRKLRELGEGAVMVLLRHRPSGQLLLGSVTHLFWNPAFPDIKALQAALLCGALAAFAREATAAAAGFVAAPGANPAMQAAPLPVPVPVVLCGDFNSMALKRLPDSFDPQVPAEGLVSGVYALLSHGSLPPEHPDHPHSRVWAEGGSGARDEERFPSLPLNCSGLRLASLNAEAFGREPPLTIRTASFAGCLDYVWLSTPQLAVASALAMPYEEDGVPGMEPSRTRGGGGGEREGSWRDPLADIAFGAIPDAAYPSDHIAVGGELVLLPGAAMAAS